jgi:tetratricopeptide (TPR) repeat protein
MSGYGAREVAKMLGLSVGQVRSWVRAGFLEPERGARGELRFSFQDLVLLRTAKGLLSAKIPSRRVRAQLGALKGRLPEGRSLRTLRIAAEGDEIVVGDGGVRMRADGQVLFDFDTAELARMAAPAALEASRAQEAVDQGPDADGWYERGCDLEEADPSEARACYRRALELEPSHPAAHLNLGRLLHEAGDPRAAAAHYRLALEADEGDATAWYNLGVALEDEGEGGGALEAYSRALAIDPSQADAHFNAARLYEKRGQKAQAIRHLGTYRKLTQGR